ncbi:MAG: winged helix-turn-helix transcriptional regulator, partial [Methanobacterium sp.]|nr:winged helix-turn-helix transcriptional regulator [Methanobacterium sp.]
VNNEDSPKEEFKKAIYNSFRALGVDDFPSMLMSVLQSEPEEISLGELSQMTGYSLSALSTTLKAMEENNMVKRFKKPKSRKVYVYMDKDLVTLYTELQKKRYNQSLLPFFQTLPRLIQKYKDNEDFKSEIEMLEDFGEQLEFLDEQSRKFIEELEKWRDIRGK